MKVDREERERREREKTDEENKLKVKLKEKGMKEKRNMFIVNNDNRTSRTVHPHIHVSAQKLL
jgi:hypothetical protein